MRVRILILIAILGCGSSVVWAGVTALRMTDRHVCPQSTGLPPIPHIGLTITTGSTNVLIEGLGAARVGDTALCVGPPATVLTGSANVLINGKPAAQSGSKSSHGGTFVGGSTTVLIGN